MSDNIKSKMEFIIQQQATFAVDIADLKEVQRQQAGNIDKLGQNIDRLTLNVDKNRGDIDRLTLNIKNLTSSVAELTVSVAELRENARERAREDRERAREGKERLDLVITEMHQGFGEMRHGFDNVIIANEVTRKLAEDVGRLAVATSRRVTALESKQDDRSS